MATTAKPYGAFLTDLASGVHNFTTSTYTLALLTSSYTPDYDGHISYADVTASEVSTSGTGYTAATLANLALTFDPATDTTKLSADAISWSALNATFRYAVIYRSGGTAATSELVGLIDFGADRTYSSEPFQISFPSGVLTIAAV